MNAYNITAAINLDDADNIVSRYAKKWDARVQTASTPDESEHIAAVLHDDHVFAAASSKISPADAIIQLANRIKAKSV